MWRNNICPYTASWPNVFPDPSDVTRLVVAYQILDESQVHLSVLDRITLQIVDPHLDHVATTSDFTHDYHVTKDMIDSRLFHFDQKMFLVYNILYKGGPPFFLAYSQVELTPQYTFRALENTTVKMRHEHNNNKHVRQEKNWGPFSYTPPRNVTDQDAPKPVLLFEYMVQPHRIIHAKMQNGHPVTKQLFKPDTRESKLNYTMFETTYCTQILQFPSDSVWNLTSIHGGSAPQYLEKQHKYLSFFHMKGKFHSSGLTTYNFGAHLFSADPPFAITHMSSEPIVADSFFKGNWAFKKADYILFPMTFFIEEESTVVLSLAKNDKYSWVVHMNLVGLVSSLIEVPSKPCDQRTDQAHKYKANF